MRERALQLYNSISRIAVNSAIPESVKSDIRQLYRIVVGEPLKHCNCPDLYSDAWLVIKLKFKKIMDTKYKLKRGVVIQTADLEGTYTRANITDDVAREYLAKFPNKRNLFEEIPEEVATEEEIPEEVATEEEIPEEVVTEEEIPEEVVTEEEIPEEVATEEKPKRKKRKQ